jgi:hypothetical protein
MSRKIQFGIAILSNLFIAYWFGASLISPAKHVNFIASVSLAIFIFEFLSLHAGGLTSSVDKGFVNRLSLLVIYAPMVVIYGFLFKDMLTPLIFITSFVAKALSRTDKDQMKVTFRSFALLILTAVVAFNAESLLTRTFPFAPGIQPVIDPNIKSTELFINPAQILLAWGAMYFLLVAIFEVGDFYKSASEKV